MRVALPLLLAATIAMAQSPPSPGPPQAAVSPIPKALLQYLDLSQPQVDAIVRLQEQWRARVAPLHARMAALQAELAAQQPPARKPRLAEPARNAQTDEVQGQITAATDQHRSKVRSLLNAVQRERLDALDRAAELLPVVTPAQCLGLLKTTPPDEPAACAETRREP